MFCNPLITSQGKTLHLKALTGKVLKFTSIRMGDGEVKPSDNPSLFTGLISEKVKMVCTSAERQLVGDVANLQCTFSNDKITEGFSWTECGIFAEDPDTKEELLYAYTYTSQNESQYIPPVESEVVEKVITIPITIEACENITFIVASSDIFATHKDLKNMRSELMADNIQNVSALPDAEDGESPNAVIQNNRLYLKI